METAFAHFDLLCVKNAFQSLAKANVWFEQNKHKFSKVLVFLVWNFCFVLLLICQNSASLSKEINRRILW